MSILNQNLLALDFWQNTVTYGGHTMPTGSIGCAALNISDEQIGQLVQLAIPLAAVVELIRTGTPAAEHFAAAKESVLQITQMMRSIYPFSLFDFLADRHDIQQIFSDEHIENAIAYINAAQETGVGATLEEQYKRGVGVVKLISELSQLGGTLMIYKHGMIELAHKLHSSKRTPDGYAKTFAEHFNAAPTLSLDNPMWMQLTNATMQYVSSVMQENGTPQLVKRLHYVSFVGMFRSDLFEGLCVGHAPRKCPVCGRWFLTTDARQTKYCDGIAPGDPRGRTCRQIAGWRNRKDRELAADHPVKKIYTRRMNTIIQSVNRGSLDPALAEKMKFLGKQKMEKALSDLSYYETRYEQEMTQTALRAEAEKK